MFVQSVQFKLKDTSKEIPSAILLLRDRAWFVRLYGEIIPELWRGDYRPYRRTNNALSHLYHNNHITEYLMLKIGCLWIVVQVGDRAWLVRLYGEIIPEI